MADTDSFDDAADYAARAIEMMGTSAIPATPRNFALWYCHVSGRHPELSESLDALVKSHSKIADEALASLYERYLGEADAAAAVDDTSRQIEESVGKVLGFMSDASQGALRYGDALESNLGQMASADSLDAIRKAVQGLVTDTKKMAQQNNLLRDRLEQSSEEISSLRQRLEDVRREAMTDGLTGIANRKFFDITLRQAAVEAMESSIPLCLMLGDIDHFKRFNDTFGHQVGDQVLKLVSMILTQNVKGRDTPARYGGEEFAVILPETALESARSLGEQIRLAVASKRIRKRSTGEDFGTITMSIGIAQFLPGEPLSDFIQRADRGLYRAKDAGRNKVVTEQELEAEAAD